MPAPTPNFFCATTNTLTASPFPPERNRFVYRRVLMPRRGSGSPYDHQWQQVRPVVLARDGFRCQIRLPGCTGVAEHVDHVVPLVEGGARLDPGNLRAACSFCNLSRNGVRQRQLAEALGAAGRAVPSREW